MKIPKWGISIDNLIFQEAAKEPKRSRTGEIEDRIWHVHRQGKKQHPDEPEDDQSHSTKGHKEITISNRILFVSLYYISAERAGAYAEDALSTLGLRRKCQPRSKLL